jgi:hypothetical protein
VRDRWRTRKRYATEHLRWDGDRTEWATSVTAAGPRREGLVRVLAAVREVARTQADELLGQVPDTGDSATGRAVDDFVEQAADALRALDEAVAETLRRLSVSGSEPGDNAIGPASDPDAYPSPRERP